MREVRSQVRPSSHAQPCGFGLAAPNPTVRKVRDLRSGAVPVLSPQIDGFRIARLGRLTEWLSVGSAVPDGRSLAHPQTPGSKTSAKWSRHTLVSRRARNSTRSHRFGDAQAGGKSSTARARARAPRRRRGSSRSETAPRAVELVVIGPDHEPGALSRRTRTFGSSPPRAVARDERSTNVPSHALSSRSNNQDPRSGDPPLGSAPGPARRAGIHPTFHSSPVVVVLLEHHAE